MFNLKRGINRLEKGIKRGLSSGASFVLHKAIPAIEKATNVGGNVLDKVAKYSKYVPVVGAEVSGLAKLGKASLSGLGKGAEATGKLIEAVKSKDVSAVKKQVSPLVKGLMV